MPLENRRLGQNNDNQLLTDYQNTTGESPIYNVIKIGLVGAAGYGLFKSGMLKDIAKPLLELGDAVAREGGDRASFMMKTIEDWTKLKNLDETQLARSTKQKYAVPTDSIFRMSSRENSIMYDIWQDARRSIERGNFSLHDLQTVKKVIRDSQEDMHLLATMIKDNQEGLAALRTDYSQTLLSKRIKELDNFTLNAVQQAGTYNPFTSEAVKAIRDATSITYEKATQQLKETGYRTAVLEDLLEIDKNTGLLKVKSGVEINLDSRTNKAGESLLENINSFLDNAEYRYIDDAGKSVSLRSNDEWKHLIVDPNIMISDNGKIIDFRMTRDNAVRFAHNLATQFKLPLVQFNPAKVIPLDKIGRYKNILGMEAPNQFDPNITRRAGMGNEAKIGSWLADTFGEEFANKPVAIINGNAFVQKEGQQLIKVGEGLKLHDITYADTAYGMKPLLNASRQIAGITTTDWSQITDDEKVLRTSQYIKKKLGDILDLGHQEVVRHGEEASKEIDSITNIDELTNDLINKVTSQKAFWTQGFNYSTLDDMIKDAVIKGADGKELTYRTMFGQGFESFNIGKRKYTPKMYTTTKRGYKLFDAYTLFREGKTEEATEQLKRFGGQIFAGRKLGDDSIMSDYFTEWSGISLAILNQLSEGLGGSSHLLGLSINSKKSTLDLGWNLIVKRALPVYAALQIPGMLNYFSEPFFGQDDDGNRDNISKVMMRGVIKPIDIKFHQAMDITGATRFFKFMQDVIPGSDQINEVQGIYQLGLGQTTEERKEYIENGYDPIRKGRWWGAGNTPWTGGKIEYWRPNIYRRVQADVDFSDSKWGSRQEYYNNAWFPNPVNPFAPINHFITDKNHYDKKHYYDRPYLQTSPEGSNIPIVGPIFSQTIGRVINPPQKMHKEYWQRGLAVDPADEEKSPLLTEGKLRTVVFNPRMPSDIGATIIKPQTFDNSKMDIATYNYIQLDLAQRNKIYQEQLSSAAYQAKQLISKTNVSIDGIQFQKTTSVLSTRTYDRYDNPYEVYSTPSGNLTVVDVPDEMNLYNVNQDLQRWSINKVIGTNQRVNVTDISGPEIPVGNDSPTIDNAFVTGLGEQYNWIGEIAGLRGFMGQQFVLGHANEEASIVESSGYAYSTNNDFWEENLGGFGGNLSEITRRFIPKRNNHINYVNPIRNTMPSWMPGSNYFTDFKHGDPYSKVMNGEERLPGEGYERLHNIRNLMEFNIGSSSIGYDQAYIVRHMLKQDVVDTGFEQDTLELGTKIHNKIEKAWEQQGIAFSTEGEIKDTRNGIIGYYDAMIHDQTSPTGVGIVDIKTTSAKKLEELRKSGKPLDHHQRQVNYYLWATGNTQSKGYIYYVDKENLNNSYTVGFNYDKDMLKDTLNNVFEARKTIRNAVEQGVIGRGELYKPMDQYRILADVAPYSQEFKDVKARLATEDLNKEEQKEFSEINKRLTQQKEPLRVYDYKFQTANLKSETVTVQKIIDNNTIVTKEYGKQHSVKFAGIRVHESNSNMYDDNRTENEAASQAIHKYIKPGSKIRIAYDADERNKYSKDSTHSIRAVVTARGTNVNKMLLNKNHATENEEDNSPAAIQARYSKGEIAFGSSMETLTHKVISRIPFVGSKWLQVRSPYEQYRAREVYGKDFQSWNHPIRDIAIPNYQQYMADKSFDGLGGIVIGAFIGSMFGKTTYGKLVGTVIGGGTVALGKAYGAIQTTKDKDWRPQRRKDQENLNEYVDILKYVKNIRLYEQYKTKSLKEDHFDVDKFIESKEAKGIANKLRQQELTEYKRKVKLDFKHRENYNFKYGEPKYEKPGMTKKDTISAINREIAEIQGDRKVTKLPANALKAIEYKQMADKTMYGYNAGDSLVNIMSALPKKDRQYFKHFMDAPEEEKEKILRIAPSYMRRALQSTWGMKMDAKPSLTEYFQHHALPNQNWIGWQEDVNLDDVKVKLVHQNNLDPGEFDIWDDNKKRADAVNIPIPKINASNTPRQTQIKLQQILGSVGFNDVQVNFGPSTIGQRTVINVKHDARNDVEQQIYTMDI